jgi:thioredoxin reductase (NADPH)
MGLLSSTRQAENDEVEESVDEILDIAIVGGGPAGLVAALYGGRARVRTALFEAGLPGGQIVTASRVENFPGFPDGVDGAEIGDLLHRQAEKWGAEIHTISGVESIRQDLCGFVLSVDGKEFKSRTVILATGAIPKKLGVPGESEFTGHGVSWCATCDGPLYHDKVVAVVGGGDSAVQEALFLTRYAKHVHLVHRREELRATACLQERCFINDKITMEWPRVLEEIIGKDGRVCAVRTKSPEDGSEKIIDVDGVFIFVGVDPQSALVADLCELDKQGFVIVDRNGRTSCAGLYAAGDVTNYELKQVVTACARGAYAVNDALRFVEVEECAIPQPGH